LLPPVFQKVNKGNPVWGIVLNGVIVASIAGLVPFGEIADMMVLGTLVAFVFVSYGAFKLQLVNPIISIVSGLSCIALITFLNPLVLKVYSITLPVGLVIYFLYGYKHSRLGKSTAAIAPSSEPEVSPS